MKARNCYKIGNPLCIQNVFLIHVYHLHSVIPVQFTVELFLSKNIEASIILEI